MTLFMPSSVLFVLYSALHCTDPSLCIPIAADLSPRLLFDIPSQVEQIAIQHDSRLFVDCTRVYHFGARYNVEMEIVLPGAMTVMESHDIALELQHKIEALEDVERAFVHV